MRSAVRGHLRHALALAATVLLAPGVLATPAVAATSASVTVNATVSRAVIPAAGHGVNSAVYDGNMNHAAVPGLLRDAGFKAIRYPGGSGEPALKTPFPPYFGLAMAGRAGVPGDTLVQTSSSNSLLSAHAVRTSSGGLNVVLVNKDINNATTVSLSYTGFTPGGTVNGLRWQRGATSISSFTQSSASSITVPAYSITILRT